MLRSAQLYEKELNEKFINIWYNIDYKWYALNPGLTSLEFGDNNFNSHAFASIDNQNNVIGFIFYDVDWSTMSASNLGIMSFDKFNIIFGKDLIQAIKDIFFKYNMNRLTFKSVADNPVKDSYFRFVRRYGGMMCGYEHQAVKLIDGTIHDLCMFEVLAENFRRHCSS